MHAFVQQSLELLCPVKPELCTLFPCPQVAGRCHLLPEGLPGVDTPLVDMSGTIK